MDFFQFYNKQAGVGFLSDIFNTNLYVYLIDNKVINIFNRFIINYICLYIAAKTYVKNTWKNI